MTGAAGVGQHRLRILVRVVKLGAWGSEVGGQKGGGQQAIGPDPGTVVL
jgi:hypothetical protein